MKKPNLALLKGSLLLCWLQWKERNMGDFIHFGYRQCFSWFYREFNQLSN